MDDLTLLSCDVADGRDNPPRGKLFILTIGVNHQIYFTAAESLTITSVDNGM